MNLEWLKKIFASLTKIPGGIWKNLTWVVTFIGFRRFLIFFFIFVSMIGAIQDSIRERSFYPFISQMGSRMLSADETLYMQVEDLKNHPEKFYVSESDLSSTDKFKAWLKRSGIYLALISTLVFYYINFWVWYKIISPRNTSMVGENIMIVIFIIFIIQFTMSNIILTSQIIKGESNMPIEELKDAPDYKVGLEVAKRVMPGKGLVNFIINLPFLASGLQGDIFKPIYHADESINNKTMGFVNPQNPKPVSINI